MMSDPGDIVRLAREAKLNGKPAIEDEAVREELVELMTEARALGLASRRGNIAPLSQTGHVTGAWQ